MGLLDVLRAFSSVKLNGGADKYVTAREFMEAQARLEASVGSILAVLRDGGTGPGAALSVLGNADDETADRADIQGAANQVLRVNSTGDALGFGAVNLASSAGVNGTLPVANGGTGLASYTAGDLLYATGAATLAKLAKGTAQQVLDMNSGATAPQWSNIGRGFSAYRDAGTLTLTSGSATVLTFDTEEDDDDNAFVHTTGIFTAPRAGRYLFSATASVPNLDDAERAFLALYKNGSAYREAGNHYSSAADLTITCHISVPVKLAVNDTVDIRLNHNEGADQSARTGIAVCWMTGVQIR